MKIGTTFRGLIGLAFGAMVLAALRGRKERPAKRRVKQRAPEFPPSKFERVVTAGAVTAYHVTQSMGTALSWLIRNRPDFKVESVPGEVPGYQDLSAVTSLRVRHEHADVNDVFYVGFLYLYEGSGDCVFEVDCEYRSWDRIVENQDETNTWIEDLLAQATELHTPTGEDVDA